MSRVVVLSWDPASRTIEYVRVNDGAGGDSVSVVVDEEWAQGVSEALGDTVLPAVADDLTADEGAVLISGQVGGSVKRCAVKMVGPPGGRRFELKPKGPGKPIATLLATDLGVEDALAGSAQKLEYLYVPGLTPPGCWLGCPGGISAWLDGQRRASEERRRADDERRAQRAMDGRFINPYTFVPFPERIDRRKPAWHHRLADGHLSGTFTVTWTFTSPFQAPEGAAGTTELRVPGSSVKGAVRSVHETLAGGCLRVFDGDFIPSYRDVPAVRPEEWTLAQVAQSTKDGQPLIVTLCDEVVWVGLEQLRKACGDSLATGSRVHVPHVPKPNSLGRRELDQDSSVQRGGDWIVLVTRAGTRSKKTRSGKPGAYFLACGRLSERTAEVTEGAWEAFRRAVAGADDLRTAQHSRRGVDHSQDQPPEQVEFDGKPVGKRRVVTGRLWPGDVMWVRRSKHGDGQATVEELSLAAVWRHPGWHANAKTSAERGEWSARARVPQDLHPCDDPQLLCPTCRIFGSADPNARGRDDPAEQRAYAGHVRFGAACSPEPVPLTLIKRAPLGAPRPGAGQFYLAYNDPSPAREKEEKPTREWGSAHEWDPARETARPRRLRGRKFYWHADSERQSPPRHQAREHQKKAKMAVDKWLAPPGTTLIQRIGFDNLSPAELGGLLAAFEPGRVLQAEGRPLRIHLGGGKPLGLGSCAAEISEVRVWDAGSRYGSAPETPADPDEYTRAFRKSCLPEVTGTWPALAAVLAEDSVDASHVWYPPGAYWAGREHNEEAFDEPFAFFTASSGMYLAPGKEPRKLVPLPEPGSGDQSLPIVREDDLK
jgi:CRISPR-associated protein (TIGR03986 family)